MWPVGATLHYGARLLVAAASLAAEHRLQVPGLQSSQHTGSVVVALGL